MTLWPTSSKKREEGESPLDPLFIFSVSLVLAAYQERVFEDSEQIFSNFTGRANPINKKMKRGTLSDSPS